jgi:hypothetical protein
MKCVCAKGGVTLSQRFSGYGRKDQDAYQTPSWVTAVIVPYLRALGVTTVWEPACGEGRILAALRDHGFDVVGTDISTGDDFLNGCSAPTTYDGIATNPPYGTGGRMAHKFVKRALELTRRRKGAVAMLLKVDFDSGKTRRHLFAECPAFVGKVVLTERIVWFEPAIAVPSDNHAWFLWSWKHTGRPTIFYAPSPGPVLLTLALLSLPPAIRARPLTGTCSEFR